MSYRRPAQTFQTYRSYHISHRTSGQPKLGQSRSPLETRPVHHKAWTRPTHARKLPQSVPKQTARPPLQEPRKVSSCLEDQRDRLPGCILLWASHGTCIPHPDYLAYVRQFSPQAGLLQASFILADWSLDFKFNILPELGAWSLESACVVPHRRINDTPRSVRSSPG